VLREKRLDGDYRPDFLFTYTWKGALHVLILELKLSANLRCLQQLAKYRHLLNEYLIDLEAETYQRGYGLRTHVNVAICALKFDDRLIQTANGFDVTLIEAVPHDDGYYFEKRVSEDVYMECLQGGFLSSLVNKLGSNLSLTRIGGDHGAAQH
jgi:hypothetical protein